MEWLKDKKNLPVVVAIAVFLMLGSGGLIAWELGLFPSGSSEATAPVAALPASPGAVPPGRAALLGLPRRLPGMPVAAASAKGASRSEKSNVVNPAVGPDPFYIPGGQKQLVSARTGTGVGGMALPLRDMIGPLNLFQIQTPAPPTPPITPINPPPTPGPDSAANIRVSGIITGSDGINAILEVGGQSQTVKPGDSLPDGSKVQNIQTNSVRLQTAGGAVISLPLSAGSPDPGTANLGGQPQFPPGTDGQPPTNQ